MVRNTKLYHKIWNTVYPEDSIIPGDGFCIHHKDKNPENNDIENLKKMTISEHHKLHMLGKNNPMFEKTGESCPNYGKRHTDDTKEKISRSMIGKNNSMYGKTGENNPMFGIQHTDESKLKMSKKRKEYWKQNSISEETRRKMSVSKMGENNPRGFEGKKHTDKVRIKISKKRKKYLQEKQLHKDMEDPNIELVLSKLNVYWKKGV